ncbi:MAG: hypothetical protein SF069_00975 [Phycisphaerae bacterium]|nr:hypothetical protein [Phycisphaerae bacterium]
MTAANPKEALESLSRYVRELVVGGFDPISEVRTNARDYAVGDGLPASAAKRIVDAELTRFYKLQRRFPKVTDNDRLDAAFAELNRSGIVALQNYLCCGTCASREIHEVMAERRDAGKLVRGYTSYDVQSTWAATDGHGIALNYGSPKRGRKAAEAIGHEVVAVLRKHGLDARWEGNWDNRIMVELRWQRRRRPPRASSPN